MKKRLLITGYDGFVGTNFIENANEFEITKVCLIKNKVEDVAFSGIDVVLHLAALVHQMKGAPESEYFRVNSDLAFEVAQKAKDQGVAQFILMSTVKVYGESTTPGNAWTESTPCNPIDPYGKSKLEAEKRITGIADDKFIVSIIRTAVVYGKGVKGNIINLTKFIDKWPIIPFGNIDNKRSITAIENLIALINRIINYKASGIFLVSDINPVSTSHLVNYIAKSLNTNNRIVNIPLFLQKAIKRFKPSIADRLFGSLELDCSYTNEILKFVPPVKSDDGIKRMIEWYKSL